MILEYGRRLALIRYDALTEGSEGDEDEEDVVGWDDAVDESALVKDYLTDNEIMRRKFLSRSIGSWPRAY